MLSPKPHTRVLNSPLPAPTQMPGSRLSLHVYKTELMLLTLHSPNLSSF